MAVGYIVLLSLFKNTDKHSPFSFYSLFHEHKHTFISRTRQPDHPPGALRHSVDLAQVNGERLADAEGEVAEDGVGGESAVAVAVEVASNQTAEI